MRKMGFAVALAGPLSNAILAVGFAALTRNPSRTSRRVRRGRRAGE